MRFVSRAVVAVWAVVCATLPASAAFQVIYDVLGVLDNGGPGLTGFATTIYCSNLSQNPVNVQVRAFDETGSLAGTAKTATISGGDTVYFSTKNTNAFLDVATNLNTGEVTGRARIFSEVPNPIVCAADYVDASQGFSPSLMIPRRMIRYPRGTSGGED